MSRRRRGEGSGGGAPGWMTTYSDLITLLFTFFVLLYSFSIIDTEKFEGIANSLQFALRGYGAPSIFDNNQPAIGPIEEVAPTEEDSTKEITEAPREEVEAGAALELLQRKINKISQIVEDFIEEEGMEAEVRLRTDRRGVIIDVNESILFDIGKAELKAESKSVLDKLTKLILSFDNDIIVEGHTDNVPISNAKYPTNWELSVARATTVVRYFAEEKGIDPSRLSAAGYGEYQPIVPNDNDQNRALNRRVNILIAVSLEGGVEDGAGS